MHIIGKGFIARNFAPLTSRHPHAILFASGVSSGGASDEAAFDREARLLKDTLRQCARSGRQLVYFSTASGGLYGRQRGGAHEDGPVHPCSPYGRHKLAMEELIRASGAGHLILRLATPVGPHQRPHQFLASLAAQVSAGAVRVHRGARRDIIDVRHVVAAVDEMLHRGVSGETVNAATGLPVPVEDVVTELEARLGPAVRHYADGAAGREPVLAVGKLHGLAPSVRAMGFGPGYLRKVLDEHVGPVLRPAGRPAG